MTDPQAAPGRKLGVVAATALVMGTMIGSGVFLLPASLAPFGWNAVGGWVLTIAGALVLAKLLADLTRHHFGQGNTTAFVRSAFGPVPEFLVAWAYLISNWVGIVGVAVAAVSYLSSRVPAVAATTTSTILSVLGIVWAITLVNLKSVRAGGNLQVVALGIKAIPLLVVVVLAVAVTAGGKADLPPFDAGEISVSAVNGAAVLTLWALLGFECASLAARQCEDPERNVPRATLWGAAFTGLLYLVVCSAIALLLPADVAASSPAPFATFVERYWSPAPATLIALFAMVSCLGALNGTILITGELTRSMAEDGLLPRWLCGTDTAGTPRRALLVSGLISSVFVLVNAGGGTQKLFEYLILLSTSSTLWLYLACALAALRLGVSPALAVVGTLYALWALWGADLKASGLSLVLMVAGLPIYWWARRERAVNTIGDGYSAG